QYTLYLVLQKVIKLFAPVIPFITEEIWSMFFSKEAKSVHVATWPEANKKFLDEKNEKAGEVIMEMITKIREHKTKNGLAMNAPVESFDLTIPKNMVKLIKDEWLTDLQQVSS